MKDQNGQKYISGSPVDLTHQGYLHFSLSSNYLIILSYRKLTSLHMMFLYANEFCPEERQLISLSLWKNPALNLFINSVHKLFLSLNLP